MTSIENANLSLKWKISSRKLRDTTRIYDKTENKTKNDYFQEMLTEVLGWGLEPAFVTGDSWYSSLENLKMIKNHHQGFLVGLESNRLVSLEKGQW